MSNCHSYPHINTAGAVPGGDSYIAYTLQNWSSDPGIGEDEVYDYRGYTHVYVTEIDDVIYECGKFYNKNNDAGILATTIEETRDSLNPYIITRRFVEVDSTVNAYYWIKKYNNYFYTAEEHISNGSFHLEIYKRDLDFTNKELVTRLQSNESFAVGCSHITSLLPDDTNISENWYMHVNTSWNTANVYYTRDFENYAKATYSGSSEVTADALVDARNVCHFNYDLGFISSVYVSGIYTPEFNGIETHSIHPLRINQGYPALIASRGNYFRTGYSFIGSNVGREALFKTGNFKDWTAVEIPDVAGSSYKYITGLATTNGVDILVAANYLFGSSYSPVIWYSPNISSWYRAVNSDQLTSIDVATKIYSLNNHNFIVYSMSQDYTVLCINKNLGDIVQPLNIQQVIASSSIGYDKRTVDLSITTKFNAGS